MGRHQLRLLKYAIKMRLYEWHPYGKDRSTVEALRGLEDMGLINRDTTTRKFRLVPPEAGFNDQVQK